MSASCSSIKPQQSNTDLSYANQEASQWRETPKLSISYAKKADTTILAGGLTLIQDKLITAALQSLDENFVSLPNPDFESFQTGKAYGNRGQCNPTYFTVGNLVKYLQDLRDKKGLSTEEIVQKYVFLTAGGCGPCRFGMYITEFKKALRDAGFDGFRIMSFEHNKGIFQESKEESVLHFTPTFFITLIKALIIGDIINLLSYKMRPYELKRGDTDKATEECREIISKAFMEKKNLVHSMWKCRKILEKVKLNRLQVKAKVMVMGEFWAAMTEGDGNYNLHRFLEEEGAECIPQPLVNRLMLSIWEAEYELAKRENLEKQSIKKVDFSTVKTKLLIKAAKVALKTYFYLYAKAIGLHDYHLPNMEKLADLAKEYYPLDASGGEGHLEVAHLIESVKDNMSHLVISVKPFGCMPSSAVSDGIQSLVTSRFPSSNFLSIETSGEGAANFYSRVQMALFKAKQSAKEEYDILTIPAHIPNKIHSYLYQPTNEKAGTAAQLLSSIEDRKI